MINSNWTRWIFASISQFFKTGIGNAFDIYVETQDRPLIEIANFTELRFNGPKTTELSKNQYQLDITINILINVIKDQNDMHKIFRFTGIIEKNFVPCIPVYKYGDTQDDDQTMFGQLVIDNEINTNHFGQISPDVPVFQSTVQANYRMLLET